MTICDLIQIACQLVKLILEILKSIWAESSCDYRNDACLSGGVGKGGGSSVCIEATAAVAEKFSCILEGLASIGWQ